MTVGPILFPEANVPTQVSPMHPFSGEECLCKKRTRKVRDHEQMLPEKTAMVYNGVDE